MKFDDNTMGTSKQNFPPLEMSSNFTDFLSSESDI